MADSKDSSDTGSIRQIILIGLAALLGAALLFALWYLFLRTPYLPAFTGIKSNDAVTITAELDRLKTPYELADDGTTILVPEGKVDAARIAILGGDLPLKGAVGFELFNKTDMGLTEFAQKINYQRALQGELARTIMALDEVDSARVHLSLPESGIFEQDRRDAKASVTIATKLDARLEPTVVRGVQQLIASAVPDLAPAIEERYASKIREATQAVGLAMPMTVLVSAFPSTVLPVQSGDNGQAAEAERTTPLKVTMTLTAEPGAGVYDRLFTTVKQAIEFDQTLGDVIDIRSEPALATPMAAPVPLPRMPTPSAPSLGFVLPSLPLWPFAAVVCIALFALVALRLRKSMDGMTLDERDAFSAKLKALLADDMPNAQR
jgi:flagellar M-ring protein FliF